MNEQQLLSELLGLTNLKVIGYRLVADESIELQIESKAAESICPDSGQVSHTLHDVGAVQALRDLPLWNRRCVLHYAPRRYKCERCQKSFVEGVGWRNVGMSCTVRYEHHLYQRARREAVSQVAQDEGVSEDMVQDIFVRWAKKRSKPAAIRR
jgi:transposase